MQLYTIVLSYRGPDTMAVPEYGVTLKIEISLFSSRITHAGEGAFVRRMYM